MGASKNRYCVLASESDGKTFTFDYYVDETKTDQKGTFLVSRSSNFKKVADNSFTIEVSASESRKTGSAVRFDALPETFALWQKAFLLAENPLKPSQELTNDLMVIGASTPLGLSTVKSLLANPKSKDFLIFTGVSDLNSSQTEQLKLLTDINLVYSDLEDYSSMKASFDGIDCIFIIALEYQNGASVAINAITAAIEAKVNHVVVISSSLPAGTIFGDQGIAVEEYVKASGILYTIVRLPLFMENVIDQLDTVSSKLEFFSPLPATASSHAASLKDIGDSIAAVMLDYRTYAGRTLVLNGTAVADSSYSEAFSAILGAPVKHVQVKKEVYKATALAKGTTPEWVIDGTLQWYDLVTGSEFALSITDLPDLLGGRELITPAEVINPVAEQLKKLREDYVTAQQLVILEKKRVVIARLERLRKETPPTIYQGSMQQKKIGTEFTYVSRFVWVDFEKKQLGWSKTSTKDGEHKTLDLTKSAVSAAGDVVSIKEEEYAHIVQLKVEDPNAWLKALQECSV